MFLYCCPSEKEQEMTSVCSIPTVELPGLKCPSIVQATKGDNIWKTTVDHIKSLISSLTKLKFSIEKCDLVPSSLYTSRIDEQVSLTESNDFMSRTLSNNLIDGYKQIQTYVKEINKLKVEFENSCKSEQCFVRVELLTEIPEESCEENFNPMTQSITWLQNYMEKEVKEFNSFMKENTSASVKFETPSSLKENFEAPNVINFRKDTDTFLKHVLLIVQEIYKKYTKNTALSVINGEEKIENGDKQNNDQEKETRGVKLKERKIEEEEWSTIENGLLKEKMIDSLTNSMSLLQMEKINDELHELLQRIMAILDMENGIEEGNTCKR